VANGIGRTGSNGTSGTPERSWVDGDRPDPLQLLAHVVLSYGFFRDIWRYNWLGGIQRSSVEEFAMSQSSVQHILSLIDALPETDREVLEQELTERAEVEWHREAGKARREAEARGIDQLVIDETIRRHRYGV